jgi:hypothetical protein
VDVRIKRKYLAGEEIALLTEHSEFTPGGIAGIALMLAFDVLMLVGCVVAPKNILQETVAALIWIGGNQLFGVMVLSGRQRHYLVRRAPQ